MQKRTHAHKKKIKWHGIKQQKHSQVSIKHMKMVAEAGLFTRTIHCQQLYKEGERVTEAEMFRLIFLLIGKQYKLECKLQIRFYVR